MSDIIDLAQARDELFRRTALEKQLQKSKIATPPERRLAMTRLCEDCDIPIPAKRLKANPAATRCIVCQTLAETKGFCDE